MGEQDSYSISRVWRLHKDLWKKNQQSLAVQMKEANSKLKKVEVNQLNEGKIELVIGQLAVSVTSE